MVPRVRVARTTHGSSDRCSTTELPRRKLGGATRFARVTFRLSSGCSDELSYAPMNAPVAAGSIFSTCQLTTNGLTRSGCCLYWCKGMTGKGVDMDVFGALPTELPRHLEPGAGLEPATTLLVGDNPHQFDPSKECWVSVWQGCLATSEAAASGAAGGSRTHFACCIDKITLTCSTQQNHFFWLSPGSSR